MWRYLAVCHLEASDWLRETNEAVYTSQNFCLKILSDLRRYQRLQEGCPLNFSSRDGLLHCKMEAEAEEEKAWCWNDSWCILLRFGSGFSGHGSKLVILALPFLLHLQASAPHRDCVLLALSNSPCLLSSASPAHTYRRLWVAGWHCMFQIHTYGILGAMLPPLLCTVVLYSPVCVSSGMWTARHLLLQAPGTSLWFGKGRPFICGLCGRGRWYCGLQTADGSFSSKEKE